MPSLTRRSLGLSALALAAATLPFPGLPLAARAATPLRIGYQKNGALVILRQQKRLDGLGFAVEWHEFASGPPLLEAVNAGAVDFGATGDTPPIFAQAAGADFVYVGAQPVAGANQAILVPRNSPIRGLADLKGKRIAYTKGSSAHNVIVSALVSVGLTPADIQSVFLQPPEAAAAFRNGALDAWVIWDPFLAIAEADPATRVLATAEGIAPTNSFFLARRSYAEQHPAVILAMLDAINGAADWARGHPAELADIMAEVTGVPLAVQRVAAPRGVYATQPLDATIIGRQQAIADSFASLRIIPAPIDIRAAVWTPPTAGAPL
ncbi:MAG TPA: aliphatic sulfonate ABC transporter substrate-binding protein [Stellaceae bacterium]|nr:aliphatic sulfonate ABC transporter substrate-binding protein [Stellaceae bacterium]